jgi:thymidylate synthase
LQNFSNLRATRTVTPGRIVFVTGKELSAVLAECAARTEIARAGVEEARRKQEEAVAKHEAVMAKQEAAVVKQEAAVVKHEEIAAKHRAATAKLDEQRTEADARWEEYRKESARKTDAIITELKEGRDERRALIEAIFRVIDRLDQQPPPPPNLRSV